MQLPGPVRATVGLFATVADEARHLPERALQLPMLAVSTALQASLRAQQRYAQLTTRGDEALARGRAGDDPPEWATFDDDPVPAEQLAPARRPAPTAAGGSGGATGGASGGAEAAASSSGDDQPDNQPTDNQPTDNQPAASDDQPAKPAASDNQPAAAADLPAKRAVAGAKTAAAKKTAARKAAAKRAAARPAADRAGPGKSVNAPRHTAPSRFDTVDLGESTPDSNPDADDPGA